MATTQLSCCAGLVATVAEPVGFVPPSPKKALAVKDLARESNGNRNLLLWSAMRGYGHRFHPSDGFVAPQAPRCSAT